MSFSNTRHRGEAECYHFKDQPDSTSRYSKVQYTTQPMSSSAAAPTIYFHRESTPIPYTLPQADMQTKFLCPGVAPNVGPNTPPSLQEDDQWHSLTPNQYRSGYHMHPTAGIGASLNASSQFTPPVSPGLHKTGSPMHGIPEPYDEDSSLLGSSAYQENMESHYAPMGFSGTVPQSLSRTADSRFSVIHSIPIYRRDTGNNYPTATRGTSGSKSLSTRSIHNKLAIGSEPSNICKICGISIQALQRHMQDKHRESLSIPPPLIDCGHDGCHRNGSNGFKRKDNLTQHRRSVHGAVIPKKSRRKGSKSESNGGK